MKKLIFFLMLITFSLLQSYDWSDFGMETGEIYNMCFLENPSYQEIICASNGFYTYETTGWTLHSYGLPVWDICADETETGDLILIMGEGTYSDGIYSYTFDISEFTVLHWFLYPSFLVKDEVSGVYYVGGSNGLVSSADGITWEIVDFFNGMNCHDMAIYQGNYVVTANDYEMCYSNNSGADWYSAENYLLITDMSFDYSGKLYGIFPYSSWSSGLYSSEDFGVNWQVEFWDTMLNTVFTDLGNRVFIGWNEGEYNAGFAQWLPEEEELYFYNYGLPNLNINKITTHPFIDCENIICCTANGSYMLTDYDITSSQNDLPELDDRISVYPNPFNPVTTISFNLTTELTESTELSIYNLRGQKMIDLPISPSQDLSYSATWDGTDDNGNSICSGIYYAIVKNGNNIQHKKITLLK